MMRVRTASRLHFGLLSLPVNESSQAAWPNVEGQRVVPTRAFGSVGLMIERPGLVVWAESSSAWSTEGALPDRTSAYANQAASALHWSGALHFRVEGSPRQHI